MSLTFKELRTANESRVRRWHGSDWKAASALWTGADWGNALAGEVGELCNLIKKMRRHELELARDETLPLEITRKMAKELADVAIYLDLTAQYYNIDLEVAIQEKFNEVSLKYGFPETL